MANAAYKQVQYQYSPRNVISFEEFKNRNNSDSVEPEEKVSNNAGKSCEVYAFRTPEEIKAMIDVLDKHIEEAPDDNKRQIAWRNKVLLVVGINIGVRSSDLRTLKWEFFFNEDGSFKRFYKIQPQKTRKYKKYVTLYFNDAVKMVIENYLAEYPYQSLDEYVFASREGDNEPLIVSSMRRIIKNAAKEAGIEQNVGTHSLRKTFGFHIWHSANDKQKALVILQQIFAHSDQTTTMKYIGLMDDEIEEAYNSIALGIDLL